ncbi:hypothetical protein [Natronolimnobius baerhuensis]|uniref:Uncharacterized protein n=1 Tax=Natronolimnobius baerhuensis TaxID=253108 RepID=A0A202EEB2_9EURY|nr:hypothetical protein [Natronolimnobius baerhuensis]OVE86460.1 hypothetical protein B2G88_05665 [Natronolimnobius baerhuensis]
MKRRTFLAVTATTTTATVAGCLGGETLSAELADGETETFEASEGDEYDVAVEVEDGDNAVVYLRYDIEKTTEEIEDEDDAAAAIGGMFSGPLISDRVEGEETFEVEIEADGYYTVGVETGAASITIS